mgnify:CR=1 FL=1
MSDNKFRFTTVTAVVIANMVGTGVFTSLGFQLLDIQSGFVLLMLWAIGGLISLCGAMTYAELGAAMPRSGGEYNFLGQLYHPSAGFVSGWISATIGFAGPVALAAITFAAYATSIAPNFTNEYLEKGLAIGLILILTSLHASNRKNSGNTQVFFTILKVVVIIAFCSLAFIAIKTPQPLSFTPTTGDQELILSSEFAVSLIYVSYAYAGWNAATYLSSELSNPQRTLPGILLTGTLVVTILYVMLNFIFLYVAPIDSLKGEIEVGVIAAQAVFGITGGKFTGFILALLLISTVSAMTIAGPRVLQVIGEDFKSLRFLSKKTDDGIPARAIYIQSSLAILFIISSTFESILVFSGFTLALNNFATVFGIFVLRYKHKHLERPYKTFLFPLPPLIYLILTGWTLWFVMINRPVEVLFSFGVILSGLLFFSFSKFKEK